MQSPLSEIVRILRNSEHLLHADNWSSANCNELFLPLPGGRRPTVSTRAGRRRSSLPGLISSILGLRLFARPHREMRARQDSLPSCAEKDKIFASFETIFLASLPSARSHSCNPN